jgi:P pilus assembly chaperone PapD
MIPHALRRLGCAFAAGAALWTLGLPSLALNVQPVIVDLLSTGRRASSVISLQNTFAETVPVEITVHPVRIVDGELREMEEEEAENLIVFPGQAVLQAGQLQAFRVQWIGDPAPQASEHYYVTVSQLPVALPENQNAIQVLHRFKVLVSVGAPDAEASLKIEMVAVRQTEDGKTQPVLTVTNAGDTYSYVGRHRMTVVQRAPGGEVVFRESFEPEEIQQRMGLGVVPSGQTRVLPINLDLPQTTGTVSVELTKVEGV